MNSTPQERFDNNTSKDKFHDNAYNDTPAEGAEDAAAEESEAIGSNGVKIPIKKTDELREATLMHIPDFVCTAICAGLNLSDLVADGFMVEPPEEKPVNNDPQVHNPHMNSEELMHQNTFRYMFDERVTEKENEAAPHLGEKYGGGYECSSAGPKVEDCLTRGAEISHWLSERMVNSEHFCD